MNYFLVDYENVHADGLRGIASLSERDKVVIFYSENAETMTFGLHRRLGESKADVSYQKVSVGGKNALDFQLCTYLGYLIGKNENSGETHYIDLDYYYTGEEYNRQSEETYYIVSGDQDYTVIIGYWMRRKISVSVIPEISAIFAPPKSPAPEKPKSVSVVKPLKKADVSGEEVRALLKSMLPAKYKKDIPTIAEIIRNGRTKQNVHSELTRAFHQGVDTSVPSEIYQSVKPLLLSDAEYLQVRLESVLPEKYRGDIPAIADIVQRFPTKQAIHGELVRAFHQGADNSKVSEIYRCVKPLLTDKT